MIDQIPGPPSCNNYEDCQNLTDVRKIKIVLQKTYTEKWKAASWILIFFLPIIHVVISLFAIGGDPNGIPVAIVNHEMNWTTKNCPLVDSCSFKFLSCRYLNTISNNTLTKIYYETPESARKAVENGDVLGAVYFTENFTDALIARLALGRFADEETLDQSEMRIWLDMTNLETVLIINRDLLVGYLNFAHKLLEKCGFNPKLVNLPIQFNEPIYGNTDLDFRSFFAPGIIIVIVFFMAAAVTLGDTRRERTGQSQHKNRTAVGVRFSTIISQFVMICTQIIIILFTTSLIIKIECKGSVLLVGVLIILQGVCGMCFGFAINSVCDKGRGATQITMGCFNMFFLLSGIVWPIESMPFILRQIGYYLPLTMPATSLMSILSRGWNLLHPRVLLGFLSTIVWSAAFLIISISFKKSNKDLIGK